MLETRSARAGTVIGVIVSIAVFSAIYLEYFGDMRVDYREQAVAIVILSTYALMNGISAGLAVKWLLEGVLPPIIYVAAAIFGSLFFIDNEPFIYWSRVDALIPFLSYVICLFAAAIVFFVIASVADWIAKGRS